MFKAFCISWQDERQLLRLGLTFFPSAAQAISFIQDYHKLPEADRALKHPFSDRALLSQDTDGVILKKTDIPETSQLGKNFEAYFLNKTLSNTHIIAFHTHPFLTPTVWYEARVAAREGTRIATPSDERCGNPIPRLSYKPFEPQEPIRSIGTSSVLRIPFRVRRRPTHG